MMLKIKTRTEVESITPYVLGKRLNEIQEEFGLKEIRKLSENENIYGCSVKVKNYLANLAEQLHLYPDGSVTDSAAAVSTHLHVKRNQLVFGNGSDEVIRLIAKAYLNYGDEAVMADKTFPRYRSNVFLEGGKPVLVPLVNGVHDLSGMLEAITVKTKMVFVCNPNNPTGTIVGKEELLAFIEQIPSHILVIVDEAYYEYVTTDDYLQTIPLLSKFSNLVILRTFSKIYGLASLRIGYGVMNEEIATQLTKVKDVFNVNQVAQRAAEISIRDVAHVQTCKEKNQIERAFLEKELGKLGLTYFPSEANFMMIDCGCTGDEITNELLRNGIVVRTGSLLGFPNKIRYTIGTRNDNQKFVSILEQKLRQGEYK
ncbi:histidinol-phosphate transaminase [Bacillus suaedaesalsae]|uniref:Histidinol-phosphate aminotransferase n=1 Tax=Bacillus suaedaesalsae TaxID=2810349 RepID=A0ABS2DLS0_9BACI|nr:histidinol-phosphate transaminase [Bacillus suaedaesalsae]MBM6619427.1 histidinol-phosphate transaminase [Bacillus suaedaesalsae]